VNWPKKPLKYPRDDAWVDPFRHLLKIKTWRNDWKRAIDKTYEWATLRWANVKIDKESLTLLKHIVNISKEDMEDYN
jgi:hypothetical protein